MSALTTQLRASIITEKTINRITGLKGRMPKRMYQAMLTELARRFEVEAEEEGDFDPRTGHLRGCGCEHCVRELQLAF